MHTRIFITWACLSLLTATPIAIGQPSIPADNKPIQIDGRSPRAGVITTSTSPIPEDLAGLEMLRDRLGVVAQLDTRAVSSINRLSRELDPADVKAGSPTHYLHFGHGDNSSVLSMTPLGETILIQHTQEPVAAWTIRAEAFERLGISLARSETGAQDWFDPTIDALEMTIPTPHVESDLVLDTRTIRSRIRSNFPSITRVIGNETFHVRLPKRFDPRVPAGVLVWISPTPSGKIHDSFKRACDELGLIAIGVDNNGNKRQITDRLQNHLDSIETLAQHARIDRDRIYLTGMSGGGRCSGILQIAFPDRFAGAVPIVGLDTYHNAPTGKAKQYWPKSFGKPGTKWLSMLKERRIRSITGTADFNEPEMIKRTEMLQKDGINAEIDVIEGMAHTFPNARQFRDALGWVDEPQRTRIESRTQEAREVLDELEDKDVSLPAVRRQLIGIVDAIPFSDEAWEAATRLGYLPLDE
jgi:dienelactone hydrolase